jgi:hypothetical protein
MASHNFLLSPGIWLGQGKITFNSTVDSIEFFTKWIVLESDQSMTCNQEVEMKGIEGKVENLYVVSKITPESFMIALDNELVGKVQGRGVIDPKNIAWEIRGQQDFEGFESFELQDNGEYVFHSEFLSPEQFRTIIDGHLWKKSE